MQTIPIMRPMLPSTEWLAAYLGKIDERRIYTNFGPLAGALEERLADHFGLPSGTVTTVANGTLALALALMAQDARRGAFCVLPAWSFVACAHAAILAGLTPYFVDVDPGTWVLDPDVIAEQISRIPGEVGAVMPVAPFGQPIVIDRWDAFYAKTRIPVVVDGAAAFDSVRASEIPVVVSLHATKVLGAGEGGLVISRNRELIRLIRIRSNFGFNNIREATLNALNAKFSEYHAAVAHAALDEWQTARTQWIAVPPPIANSLPMWAASPCRRVLAIRGFLQRACCMPKARRIISRMRLAQRPSKPGDGGEEALTVTA